MILNRGEYQISARIRLSLGLDSLILKRDQLNPTMKQLLRFLVIALGLGCTLPLVANPALSGESILEFTALAPAADEQPSMARYVTNQPPADWFQPAFDDSKWAQGKGGFGTASTPGAIIGTVWNTPDIWLRRSIQVPTAPERDIQLWLRHDEDAEVYLNGVLAVRAGGWNDDYDVYPLTAAARAALQSGTNLLAIHCHQTDGGQYIDAGLVTASPGPAQTNRWSRERAMDWFTSQPLPIGFNYVPANCISYTEMWMDYAFDAKLIDRELALAQDVGFNCVRVVLPFVVWEAEPDAFKQRFETFLAICEKRGLNVLPCFFDDCVFGPISDPTFGRQPGVVAGWYANSWTPSPGHKRVRDPETRPQLERYVKDVITAHRKDSRILCWDVYNEPSNSGMGNASLPLLKDAFRWAREINPVQPITSGMWGGSPRVMSFLQSASDVITFHNYQPAAELRAEIRDLKKLGRPLICTEWLNRPQNSTVEKCLPVFVEEAVGALSWGLVNGRTQTHLPWGHRPGDPAPKIWQHDLFRPDYTPYDARELDWFRAAIQGNRKASVRRVPNGSKQ